MGLKKLQVIAKPQILKRLSAAHKAQREVADKIIRVRWRLLEPSCRR